MATWKLYAKYKKSTIERELFIKGNRTIVVETGWRGGDFTVETTDNNIPDIDVINKDGINVYDSIADNVDAVDLNSTFDGCWEEIEFPDDMPEEERTRLQKLIDEDGFFDALESEDWYSTDSEMWLQGPLVIEDENGNVLADGEPGSDKQQW